MPGAPVFLFSGQGAQKPGMGADLFDVKEVAETLACASDVFGFDVAGLMANAAPERLDDTRYAQPALCALSVALARALAARGVEPAAVLGFSLGQASALAASGMLSCEATFAFVKERSRLMAEAAAAHPGAMSALLKADEAGVQALCDECAQGDVLVPANFNCPGQIVIAGTSAAVERAEAAWAASGKRFSRLATSGAFHSPLMAEAAEGLAAYLKDVAFEEARVPLVCNVDASPACGGRRARPPGAPPHEPRALRAERAGARGRRRGHVRGSGLRRRALRPGEAHRPWRRARVRAGPGEP